MLKTTRISINNDKKPKTSGFTLLELLVATSIFSVILLVITAGILSFSRQYYKGVISSSTQNTARTIIAEMTQSIQFGSTIIPTLSGGGGVKGMCVDNKLFSFQVGRQVTDNGGVASLHQGYHAFLRSPLSSGCSASTMPLAMPNSSSLPAGQRELLANHMRLADLDVTSLNASRGLYSVHVRVVYGDDDLLCSVAAGDCSADSASSNLMAADLSCKSKVGSQFCAVSDLTTTVQKRLQ